MQIYVSVNTLCLEPDTFEAHVAAGAQLGAAGISPERDAIAACGAQRARELLDRAELSIPLLTHRAFGYRTASEAAKERDRLNESIDLARAIGAKSVCLTSGGRGELPWREAAQRFVAAIEPCVEHARAAGVTLGLEPTSHLYADVSIVHRLMDTVTLASAAGIGVGIDLFPCWVDADIEAAIAAAAPFCAFVQVSDYILGDRGLPCRAIPGDGALPLERLIAVILASGYRGAFDLEIIGPRLIAEGRHAGLRRALVRLGQMIEAGINA